MLIKAKELKTGDVFMFNNQEQVAIDTVLGNCLWITNRENYLARCKGANDLVYGYTNATILSIKSNAIVKLIANIEQ